MFHPGGRALLTASLDGTARLWGLSRDDRPADVLVLQAEVLAGRRIDQTGGEVPLGAAEMSRAWARLRALESDNPSADPRGRVRSRIAWHRREARRLEANHQEAAAAWHLNRLRALEPDGPRADRSPGPPGTR